MQCQRTPLLVASSQSLPVLAALRKQFEGRVDGHYHGGGEFEVAQIVKLLLVLGVSLQHEALHAAVLASDALLNQLFHQEVVHQLVCLKLPPHLPAVDSVPAHLFCDEFAGGDVNKSVVLCQFLAQRCPSAEGRSHNHYLGAHSGQAGESFNAECFLCVKRCTWSSLMTYGYDISLERSI